MGEREKFQVNLYVNHNFFFFFLTFVMKSNKRFGAISFHQLVCLKITQDHKILTWLSLSTVSISLYSKYVVNEPFMLKILSQHDCF